MAHSWLAMGMLGAMAASDIAASHPLRPVVIAHRGASAHAPEHTFAALDRAVAAGADYLEQDLQMTADGVLIVMHDDTLDRTARGPVADCSGAVATRSLAQLERCEVGSWFNTTNPERARPEFELQPIPTLRAVLERYPQGRFYIETKQPEAAPGMEEALVDLLGEFGLLTAPDDGTLPRVILQSFSSQSLLKLKELAPEVSRVQLLGRQLPSGLVELLPEIRRYADGIGPNYQSVDAAFMRAASAARLLVHPYTVNDPDEMQRLLRLGVNGMFSDDPALLRRAIERTTP